jgi:hypothetical protein
MNTMMETLGAICGTMIAGALLIMLGAFLIGIGPIGWIFLAVLVLSD